MFMRDTCGTALIVLQPRLYSYRAQVFDALVDRYTIFGIFNLRCPAPKFTYHNIPENKFVGWMIAFIVCLYQAKCNYKRVILFSPAYTTHAGIVVSTLLSKLFQLKVVVHGQANFKKSPTSLIGNLIAFYWLAISDKYISYSEIGLDFPYNKSPKVLIVQNRFESLESLDIFASPQITVSNSSNSFKLKLLFIGRYRDNCGLDFLINTLSLLKDSHSFELHLISDFTQVEHDFIISHGAIYGKEILDVAQECHIGIYPGDAGLSILHYMGLGLCPITHSSIRDHSGPEPNYIKHGYNGFTYEKNSKDDLLRLLKFLYANPDVLNFARTNAFAFAKNVHKKPYSQEFDAVFSSI